MTFSALIRSLRLCCFVLFYTLTPFAIFVVDSGSFKYSLFLFCCALHLLRQSLAGRTSALEFTLSSVSLILFIIPAIALYEFRRIDVFILVFYFILVADLLLYTRMIFIKEPGYLPAYKILDYSNNKGIKCFFWFLMFWSLVAGSFLPNTPLMSYLSFSLSYGLSLVFFERILISGPTNKALFFYLLSYLFVVVIYVVFYWSGFGRLLVGAYILMPVLLVNYYKDIGLRFWQAVGLCFPALYYAQLSRYDVISSAEQIFIGSAGHHLIVTKDLFDIKFTVFASGFSQFLDQFSLFFLNWVPRDLWVSKPVGAGLISVDDIYGRTGVSENYSQSLGYIGEQIYLLGDFFVVGVFLVLSLTIFLVKYFIKYSRGYIAPVIIWDVSLISYFWGSMATFGARVWFLLIPALILSRFLMSPAHGK